MEASASRELLPLTQTSSRTLAGAAAAVVVVVGDLRHWRGTDERPSVMPPRTQTNSRTVVAAVVVGAGRRILRIYAMFTRM